MGSNGNGLGVFTLDTLTSDPSHVGTVQLSVVSTNATLFTHANQATALLRGTNLGQQGQGASGVATLTAPGRSSGTSTANGQVVGQIGTQGANMLVYPWALADVSATGNGIGFATYDLNNNGIRPLNINNPALLPVSQFGSDGVVLNNGNFLASTTDNGLVNSAVATTSGSPGIYDLNSLTIDASTGGNLTISASTTVVLESGGLLALNGTSTISGPGALSPLGNAVLYIHTPNPDSGGTTRLNINVPILNTTAPVVKSDNGMASFGVPQIYTAGTYVNGGTLQLAAGNQTLFQPFETPPSAGNTASSLQAAPRRSTPAAAWIWTATARPSRSSMPAHHPVQRRLDRQQQRDDGHPPHRAQRQPDLAGQHHGQDQLHPRRQ